MPPAPLGRRSPKSLLSPSPRMSPRRGLSRALSACLAESFKKHSTQNGGHVGVVPGPGVASPLSVLSPNASDIDWKLWWDERLQQLDQRVRIEVPFSRAPGRQKPEAADEAKLLIN